MTPIAKYLKEIIEKNGIKSERQLAIQLKLSSGSIYNVLSGSNVPTDEVCKRIAALSGDPIEKVLLLAQVSKAPETSRHAWERILKATAKAGVFTLTLLVLATAALPSLNPSHTMYIMSNYIQGPG